MKRAHNRVIPFIAVTQLAAWALPFFILKENRVVSGSALYSWDIAPVWCAIALPLLICALLLYTAYMPHRGVSLVCGALAVVQILFACSAVAISAAYTEQWGGNARIGLHLGFWVMLFSAALLASRVGAALSRGASRLIAFVMVAICVVSIALGAFSHVGVYQEFVNNRSRFAQELFNHLFLVFISVGAATFVGIPTGVFAWRRRNIGRIVFSLVNGIQTIPSLALFGLIIGPLSILTRAIPALRAIGITGIGNTPALIALFLYALLPIVQNTYSGLANIPRAVIDAGMGMGMNRRQLWRHIEFPLSFALIFNGFRTAMVQTVGNATVAALIGAAGLGGFIFRGIGSAAADLVMLGVVPIVLLSVTLDNLLTYLNQIYKKYVLHRREI